MNASKGTLVVVCVLLSLALLRGSAVTPLQPTTNTVEPQLDAVFVVAEGVPPIVNSPPDFSYEQDATGNTINWMFNSSNPNDYRVDGNGTTVGSTSWTTNGTYPFSVDGLSPGVYNHTVTVTNTFLNESKDTVFVTVIAGAPPTWDQVPVDQTIEYGSSFRYDLNASDFSGISGWWINDTTRFQIDTSGIITDKSTLPVGTYGIRVNVSDNASHTLSGTFKVTVQDTTPPTWVQAPLDQTVEFGSSFRYDLNATDLSTITWWVNDTVRFSIDGSGIIRNATNLAVGVYGLRVNATDSYGNILSATFKVTVQDTTPPTWVQTPVDQTVELGTAFRYDLNATDLSGVTWWVNDTVRFSIDGSGIIINATNVPVGLYGLRVNATDGHGNILSATFKVTVQDTTPPSWVQSPVDQTLEFGASFRYDLNATDLSGITWWINDTVRFSIDGSGVIRNATNLAVGVYGVRVNATDSYSNVRSATFKVTVQDTTPPSWVQTPIDQTVEFGTSFRYDLNATDLSGVTWWINDTVRFSIDGNGVIRNATNLAVGVYGVRVNATDGHSNILSATFKVAVQDTTPPAWVQTPVDQTIEVGAALRYDLNATDLSGVTWWINDTVQFSIDSSGIVRNATNLAFGVYGLRVNATDSHGNILSATFKVMVGDTLPPTWDQTPVDQAAEFGVAFRYDLNASDPSGVTWWMNDTGRFSIDSSGIIRNATNLAVGVYGLRVNATDSHSNILSATFRVTVRDTKPPAWVQAPVDQTIEFGTAFRYDLNATDLSGVTWWINDTGRFSIDGSGIIRNATNLVVGVHGIRVNATDGYGNTLSGTFKVTVRDTTAPMWVEVPVDQTIELGTVFRYDLNATDLSGIAGWWVNDTAHFAVDGNGIVRNATNIAVGVYHVRVNATDGQGNILSGTFKLAVLDTVDPAWVQVPVDQITELGTAFRYDLNATDLSGTVSWWINDTEHFSIDIDGIVRNATFISVGPYPVRVNATDVNGNVLTGTFTVTVRDTTPPSWVQVPVDQTIEFGSSFRYDLNATDLSGIDSWWINDTTNFVIDGAGVITNTVSLAVGVYGLEVHVYDGEGIPLIGTFNVIVQDTIPPAWDQVPVDQETDFRNPFRYDLNASDVSGIFGWWINDTVNFQIDSSGIITNISSLSIRVYGIRVDVTDNHGLVLSGTFRINSRDTSMPVWDQVPTDQTIEFGDAFRYHLNASHPSGIASWWLNDTTNFDIDSNGVVTNKTGLAVGTYPLMVNVTNNLSNTISANFTVTVQPSAPPTWSQVPTDQVIEFGNNFRYDLNATDFSGIGSWWINDTTNFVIDSAGVITNIVPLSVQVYVLTVNVTDRLGNVQTATFKVTVQDTIAPTWLQAPVDQEFEEGSSFRYDLNATDLSGIDHYWVNDTTHFTISADGVITNSTVLAASVYWLQVYANDTQGNTLSSTFKITVQPSAAPTWDQTPADQIIELGKGLRYDLNATDFSSISTWWINDTVHFAVDGSGVITNKTSLAVGAYALRVNVNDTLGNTQTAVFTVTVEDTTSPVWTQTPIDLEYETNTTGHTLSWTVYDLAPGTVQLLRNGTPVTAPAWTNPSQVITINVDGLSAGAYNYTITLRDSSGNAVTDTVWVMVTQPTTSTSPTGNIITAILNFLMNGYVVAGIILAVALLAVFRGRKGAKPYEPRDLTTKFK
ncbi:MAG: hypothetical protein C4K47_02690 [Candidatus Thorarchaeota archaeon]|nr:MAG: hypothetical protein C4K47_02690 [Candidatus Thorarchaeota archaeon]